MSFNETKRNPPMTGKAAENKLCPECGLPPLDLAPYCENPIHTEAHAERKKLERERMKPPTDPVALAIWNARGGPPPVKFRGFA